MRCVGSFILSFLFIVAPTALVAQNSNTVPPGGALVIGPFEVSNQVTEFESFEQPSVGTIMLSDGKTRLVYSAPENVDKVTNISLAFKLTGESAPRSSEIKVDPAYSAVSRSVAAVAIEWLFVLLVVALFIEAAVAFCVAAIRVIIRFFGGKQALNENGPKPSVYKPLFALILSGLVVVSFGMAPLSDIMAAFGDHPVFSIGASLKNLTDAVVTTLIVAGGAESVRRIAAGIAQGLNVPDPKQLTKLQERADTQV